MGIYDSIIKDAQSAIDFNEFEKFELQSQKSNRELSAGQITMTTTNKDSSNSKIKHKNNILGL
ncbi:MAG: hypothetical protein WA364_23100 [Candidatus Nitrosopolaris sp.]